MLPRLIETALSLAGLLLLAACGGVATSPRAEAPAPAPTVTDAQLLSGVSGCVAGVCTLAGRADGVGSTASYTVALVERMPSARDGFASLTVVAARMHPAAGASAVTDVLPMAPLAVDRVGPLTSDTTRHVFATASVGADGQQVLALGVDGAGLLSTFGTLTERRDHGFDTGSRTVGSRIAEALDLDGDGVRELVVGHDDCKPDCARGTVVGTVLTWNGRDYVADRCLPYDASLLPAGPPTALPPGRTRC